MADTSVSGAAPRESSVQCLSPAGLHRMAYVEWGDPGNDRVLLCAHGLTRSGRDFDALSRALASHYRVVCPDVVGRGRSDWLAEPQYYATPQYVADMVTLIARLGARRVDWFGTSMGGLIGMALAALPSTPIARLLLNDVGPRLNPAALARIGAYVGASPTFASREEGLRYLAGIAADFGTHSDAQWTALNGPLLRECDGVWRLRQDPAIAVPFRATASAVARAGEALLWRAFEAIEIPVLVVRGARSDLLLAETVQEMMRRGRRVGSVEVAHVGHAPSFMHADQIELARRFFCSPTT